VVKVSRKVIAAGVIVVAAVWFILVNRGRVSIYLWVPKVTAPLWLVLLITFAAGMATMWLLRRGKNRDKRGSAAASRDHEKSGTSPRG
jgi:uncharacterized integral membrane protein